MLKFLLLGFFIQFITSLDDTLTRIPVSASLTRKRKGKVAFAIGNILAVALAVTFAFLFSAFLSDLPYTNYVVAGLVLLLAVIIYLDILKGALATRWILNCVDQCLQKGSYSLLARGL